jgi:para-nitrobenzyl esterase
MTRIASALSIVAFALLQGCAQFGMPTTQRDTSFGPVIGRADEAGGLSWKGVPFAQPPVGSLRWKAPADPLPWTQPRATSAFAPACVQTGRLYSPGASGGYDDTIGSRLGKTVGSEDCLYLNIWVPAGRPAAPRPVIVWIYGGSNITGYTADPVYDGAALARSQDAVVVSVAYRVGIFGFLDAAVLKSGNAEDDSGNFALLDIVKGLEFVQREIANFGGDAARVTLMGQSAGAVNIYALLASPMVVARPRPLFHRFVALSGGISTAATLPPGAIPGVLPKPVWEARGEALLLQSLIAAGQANDEAGARVLAGARGAQAMAEHLRGLSADALLDTVRTRLAPRGMATSNPIPDGWVVAPDPIAAMRAGRYVKVPVLAGNTRDETKLFPQLLAIRPDLGGVSGRLLDDAALFAIVSRRDAGAASATTIEKWIPAAYLPVDKPGAGFNARTAELGRIWFDAIRIDALNALRSQQLDVWFYEFDWDRLPKPYDVIYGAAHTFDLPFIFGNFGPSLYANIIVTPANERGRLALSEKMMRSIGAFARRGDPNNGALGVAWQPWPSRLLFGADDERANIRAR